jgi:hypothetical protein
MIFVDVSVKLQGAGWIHYSFQMPHTVKRHTYLNIICEILGSHSSRGRWWWRRHAPLKRRYTLRLLGAISQLIIFAAVRKWNVTKYNNSFPGSCAVLNTPCLHLRMSVMRTFVTLLIVSYYYAIQCWLIYLPTGNYDVPVICFISICSCPS